MSGILLFSYLPVVSRRLILSLMHVTVFLKFFVGITPHSSRYFLQFTHWILYMFVHLSCWLQKNKTKQKKTKTKQNKTKKKRKENKTKQKKTKTIQNETKQNKTKTKQI